MLHSAVFVDLWALNLVMPDFLWIHPSWLIDFGVQTGLDLLESFCCTSGSYSFSPRWILWFLRRGELMTAIPSPGKLGAGSPLSTWMLLGFLETFGNRIICDIATICQIWLQWLMGSKIIVGLGVNERKHAMLFQDPGAQLFSSVLPQAGEAFQIIADRDSSNTSSQGSSGSFSEDIFVKAWIFWSSMLWSWPLAGVSQ